VKPRVCFVTVCGGGEDYDFLLGSIEHHAKLGNHFILDTSPESRRVIYDVPESAFVAWNPAYGDGWKNFKLRTAIDDAIIMAKLIYPESDVIAILDSDEFYSLDSESLLFPFATEKMVQVKTITWKPDGKAYDFGESEWHARLWPAKMNVRIARNEAWLVHPKYNGNPEHHPVYCAPSDQDVMRFHGPFHHHVHYALGEKAQQLETAENTISGWAAGGVEVPPVPWPELLVGWKRHGIRPSSLFMRVHPASPAQPERQEVDSTSRGG